MEYKKGRTQNKQDVCSDGSKSKVNDTYQFNTIQTMAAVVLLKCNKQSVPSRTEQTTNSGKGQYSSTARNLIVFQLPCILVLSYGLEYGDQSVETVGTRLLVLPELDHPSHAHGRLLTISTGDCLQIGWS